MGIKTEARRPHSVLDTYHVGSRFFVSGLGAYEGLLRITNQETVVRGTYINKSDLGWQYSEERGDRRT